MNITTKFSIGDTVVPISRRSETLSDPCPECDGTGELALVKGGTVRCRARGCWSGRINRSQIHPWAVREDLASTVGSIRAQQDCLTYLPERVGTLEIRYMIFSTGVGSGQTWIESDLYPDVNAAQAECDRRNAVIAECVR